VRKLPEVEDAKALMMEAMDWSVMRWLWEKRMVRETADLANAALDRLDKKVKTQWSAELRAAYRDLEAASRNSKSRRAPSNAQQPKSAVDGEVKRLAEKMKQADDAAYRARMDAEETFDQAERQMSTSMAREGCQKAIDSWRLHEKAIRQSEALAAQADSSG
jgi:hypothetical protein